MSSEPRAFLAIDHGSATSSVALIGRVASAWRLLATISVPAGSDIERAVALLGRRLIAADPGMARQLGIGSGAVAVDDLPRLEVRSHRPRRLAVVAGSDRTLGDLVAVADRSGWRVTSASMERADPLAMSRMLLDADTAAVLAGAADPPRADERAAIRELGALVAAVAERRPELTVVLAGAMAEAVPSVTQPGERPGEVVLAPAAPTDPAEGGAGPLADLLLELAMPVDDPRRTVAPATQALADVLDRRVEAIVLGHDASVRAWASPTAGGREGMTRLAVVAAAAVAPDDPDDAVVDGVLVWSTVPTDRHRLRDRLRELRIAPWSDAAGDGAALRMAAARAALVRLAGATAERTTDPVPDLVVTGSGVWSAVPAPAVTLGIVDVLRRPGAIQLAFDHARLLGVLGAIPDAGERLALVRDLVDDLLVPLGSVVTPAGLRAGRSAGAVTVHALGATTQLDLVPGGLELVDLPPGETAVAEFRFRDTVRLGARGRHFALDVAGGLGGLLVDLRDIPLRLPERADRRRDLLGAWQTALWSGADE